MGLLKLDDLTADEREAYEAWGDGAADYSGGDCSTIGFAWAAFIGDTKEPSIVLTEDEYGFVDATSYDPARYSKFAERLAMLRAADERLEDE